MVRVKAVARWGSAVFAVWFTVAPGHSEASDRATPPETLASKLALWRDGDGMSGDWFGWRSRLSEAGIVPYANWTGEVYRNVDGGLRTGTDWLGLMEFGVEVDLQTLLGWEGARLHTRALWIQSDADPSERVGNFDEISNVSGVEAVRLYELYLAQRFRDGRLAFKFGQLALDDDFMVSGGASLFLNASLGAMPVQSENTRAPIYPLGALGVHGRWSPADPITFQIGLYNGDAGSEDSNAGFDYSFGRSEGVMLIGEAAIETALVGRDATYKVGGYYHSGEFADFDSDGSHRGRFAFYLIADQVLIGTRDDNRLAAFVRLGWSPLDDRSIIDWYVDAGITARGFRAVDRVGVGVVHSNFGNAFGSANSEMGTRTTNHEVVVEVTYRAELTPWLSLQPDLQVVIDPQDAQASDAIVAGIRIAITF